MAIRTRQSGRLLRQRAWNGVADEGFFGSRAGSGALRSVGGPSGDLWRNRPLVGECPGCAAREMQVPRQRGPLGRQFGAPAAMRIRDHGGRPAAPRLLRDGGRHARGDDRCRAGAFGGAWLPHRLPQGGEAVFAALRGRAFRHRALRPCLRPRSRPAAAAGGNPARAAPAWRADVLLHAAGSGRRAASRADARPCRAGPAEAEAIASSSAAAAAGSGRAAAASPPRPSASVLRLVSSIPFLLRRTGAVTP